MKNIKYIFLTILIAANFSCEKLVEGINDNPNGISSDNFEAGVLLLKGIELANISLQAGHQTRITCMWSGQTKGPLVSSAEILYSYKLL